MRKTWLFNMLFGLSLFAALHAQAGALVDANATGETKILYTNLKNLSTTISNMGTNKRTLFGHQNTTIEGQNFVDATGVTDQSDVVKSVGSFPAVYGYDFNRGASGSNAVAPYSTYQAHLNNAYSRNGIVTFSWHAKNPVTLGDYKDESGNPVAAILAGGTARTRYLSWLDDIADFAHQTARPIIFRPLHEDNGNWFWWGTDNASNAQFIQLWRMTVEYLRDSKGVHNFLYAYSPSSHRPGFYGSRYPGDAHVDIIGADIYGVGNFSNDIVNAATTIVNFAHARGKVPALTEIGPRDGFSDPQARNDFYTNVLLYPIKNNASARRIAYVHTWRNGGTSHYWVPLTGDPAHSSFNTFFQDQATVFDNRLFNLYQPNSMTNMGFPYCSSSSTTDPDGDGWGWEQNSYSCVMVGGSADPSFGIARGNYRYCDPRVAVQDNDGDGWGWQSQKSCVVPGSPADLNANW